MSCFRIQTKDAGSEMTIVIEPYDPKECGKKLPRNFKADILLSSPASAGGVKEAGFVVDSEGEFERQDTFVYSIAHFVTKDEKPVEKRLLYRIEAEGMSLVHLGGLSRPLENGELESLRSVDILLLPVGGGGSLDTKEAQEVISQIEPRVVVPMNYKISGINAATAKKLETADKFAKALGAAGTEPKLKIAKKNLPEDKMEVHVLEAA